MARLLECALVSPPMVRSFPTQTDHREHASATNSIRHAHHYGPWMQLWRKPNLLEIQLYISGFSKFKKKKISITYKPKANTTNSYKGSYYIPTALFSCNGWKGSCYIPGVISFSIKREPSIPFLSPCFTQSFPCKAKAYLSITMINARIVTCFLGFFTQLVSLLRISAALIILSAGSASGDRSSEKRDTESTDVAATDDGGVCNCQTEFKISTNRKL